MTLALLFPQLLLARAPDLGEASPAALAANGRILAANRPARRTGVATGQTVDAALRLAPSLTLRRIAASSDSLFSELTALITALLSAIASRTPEKAADARRVRWFRIEDSGAALALVERNLSESQVVRTLRELGLECVAASGSSVADAAAAVMREVFRTGGDADLPERLRFRAAVAGDAPATPVLSISASPSELAYGALASRRLAAAALAAARAEGIDRMRILPNDSTFYDALREEDATAPAPLFSRTWPTNGEPAERMREADRLARAILDALRLSAAGGLSIRIGRSRDALAEHAKRSAFARSMIERFGEERVSVLEGGD